MACLCSVNTTCQGCRNVYSLGWSLFFVRNNFCNTFLDHQASLFSNSIEMECYLRELCFNLCGDTFLNDSPCIYILIDTHKCIHAIYTLSKLFYISFLETLSLNMSFRHLHLIS